MILPSNLDAEFRVTIKHLNEMAAACANDPSGDSADYQRQADAIEMFYVLMHAHDLKTAEARRYDPEFTP